MAMLRAISHDRLIPLGDLVAGFPEDSLGRQNRLCPELLSGGFFTGSLGGPKWAGRLIRHLGAGVAAEYALNRATGLRMVGIGKTIFRSGSIRRFSIFLDLDRTLYSVDPGRIITGRGLCDQEKGRRQKNGGVGGGRG